MRWRILPVAASSARKSPSSPAVKTNPEAVTAIPATIGWDVSRRHRTTPVSASTAVIQPFLRSSLSPKAFAEPRKGLPASKTGAFVAERKGLRQNASHADRAYGACCGQKKTELHARRRRGG